MNVKKILYLDEVINKPYSNVTIELKENFKIEELKNMLSQNGDTKINITSTSDADISSVTLSTHSFNAVSKFPERDIVEINFISQTSNI